jgi:DNA polymerase (family 10)
LDNKDVAKMLKQIAVLMQLTGENPFKVRAYENAARTVERLNEDILSIREDDRLSDIKGIGKNIAAKIEEFLDTQSCQYLEELKKQVPEGLLKMLEIPGMGPKKVKAVYAKLGISTVGELEYACNENRLIDLPGFGAKTQEKILQGIEFLKKYEKYHLYYRAKHEAEQVIRYLQDCKNITRISLAGSLRRKKEIVKDVDIVTAVPEANREKVAEYICQYPGVQSIVGKGLTKVSVLVENGIQIDVRMVTEKEFPFALHHFTGSKEHNTQMRQIAKSRGLKMNEYGLFKGEETIACQSEEEIFSALSMQYIPPELRENMGEIELALEHQIPALVDVKDIQGMLHVHSLYSDGAMPIEELVRESVLRGYQYLGISDHSKSSFYANGLDENRIREQHQEIDRLNEKYRGQITILKGIECDILSDGSLDYDDEILKLFDFVIVSVHQNLKMDKETATRRMIRAMEHPEVNILGHPTGRLLLSRNGYELDWNKIFDAALANQVAIEINANPLRLDMDWRVALRAREKGIKISINTDAHQVSGFDHLEYGVNIARKAFYSKEGVINSFSLEQIRKFFEK